jgi:hypothetical protein
MCLNDMRLHLTNYLCIRDVGRNLLRDSTVLIVSVIAEYIAIRSHNSMYLVTQSIHANIELRNTDVF